jgi:hypothetical protein
MSARTRSITAEERFWPNVDKTDACWLWTGYIKPNGYASFYPGGGRHVGKIYAHRFAYELSHGPIPSGLEIDHLCHVRHCVNPSHLDVVTHRVNLDRRNAALGWALPKVPKVRVVETHCRKRGHAFDGDNTYVSPKSGKRMCKACAHIRYLATRAA